MASDNTPSGIRYRPLNGLGDEAIVISLGKWMKFVGVFTVIVAGLALAGALLSGCGALMGGASHSAPAALGSS